MSPRRPAFRGAPLPDAITLAAQLWETPGSREQVHADALSRAELGRRAVNCLVGPGLPARRSPVPVMPGSPLRDVPFLLKDLADLEGVATRAGSRITDGVAVASASSPYAERIEAIGLRVIGKTSTSEFGLMPATEPLAFGPTMNPWDWSLSAGGSSGGAAAAVARGVVPMAHATDGGGSLRIPAPCCGLFGLKPSRGRLVGSSSSPSPTNLAVDHVVTRSVRDSALMFALTERPGTGGPPPVGLVKTPSSRRLRIGVVSLDLSRSPPSPPILDALDEAKALLESLGHSVHETDWPVDGDFFRDFELLWARMAAGAVAAAERTYGQAAARSALEPFTLDLAGSLGEWDPAMQGRAMARLGSAIARHDDWFRGESLDLVLSPVTGHPAPPIGRLAPDVPFPELMARLRRFTGYTPYHNVTGAPAMSVPLHWTPEGVPIGAQFTAPIGGEQRLFELAYELEIAQPWSWRFGARQDLEDAGHQITQTSPVPP